VYEISAIYKERVLVCLCNLITSDGDFSSGGGCGLRRSGDIVKDASISSGIENQLVARFKIRLPQNPRNRNCFSNKT